VICITHTTVLGRRALKKFFIFCDVRWRFNK
jgi:hypothetical protein